MKTRMMWVVVAVVASLVLVAGAAGAIPALLAPGDPVAGTINYQGRLTDPDGLPLDGSFPMRFQVYDDPAAGVLKWDSDVVDVGVDNGLFNVGLEVDPYHFNGQGLWLRIQVSGEWLSPRQALLPVPYALSLKPGAQIWGAFDRNWLLKVKNSANPATGAAIWGEAATGMAVYGTSSGGHGVHGYTDNGYAVSGTDAGATQERGFGGYFTSLNGVGVYGGSSADITAGNTYAPGVYGKSQNGTGVYGLSESSKAGVTGQSTDGNGVRGYSNNSTGVWGSTLGGSGDYGVYGTGGDLTYGVYGNKSGTGGGLGVYGENDGTGAGVSGNSADGGGVWGYSATYHGVHGTTGATDNNYGLYTADNLYSLNYHSLGATMQVVQNGDAEPLEPGDVVVIAGLGDAPADGLPQVILVRKVSEVGSTAVLGVVSASYAKERLTTEGDPTGASGLDSEIPLSEAKPVAPGDYLLVVVRGPCQVKASATGGAIQVGDLLASAGAAGHAARAGSVWVEGVAMAAPGTVFGKALEPLDAGEGLIYVYVTLQ
jgi:hypothetical protein